MNAQDLNERLDSLSKANSNALSGTGCVNIWELRMAYDVLRERLAIVYEDAITTKDIMSEVTRRMYATMATAAGEGEQTKQVDCEHQQVFGFYKR